MKLRKTLAGILGAVVMLLGVGTFEHVNGHFNDYKEVYAANEPVTVVKSSFAKTADTFDGGVASYTTDKGGGTSNPSVNSNQIRLYQNKSGKPGGNIKISVKDGYVISSATIGSSMATKVDYAIGDNALASANYSLKANNKYTVNNINDSSITFHCMGTTSSSRLYVNYLSVTYVSTVSSDCEHTNTTETSKDATCTEDGYYKVVCNDCSEIITDETISAGHKYEDYVCSVCGDKFSGYILVKSANELKDGDKVVIAAKDSDYALSTTQNNNNRGQATITKSDETIELGNDVQELTLNVGKSTGTFAFFTGSGYLCAASSGSNHLKTESTLSPNSSWKITISGDGTATIVAQGSYTRNTMQYNSQSSLFACYASASQQSISIYKYVEPSDIHVHNYENIEDENCLVEGKNPTCTTYGEYYKSCSECYALSEETFIGTTLLNHNYDNYICTMCGSLKEGKTYSDSVISLFNDYYNNGYYTKDTELNLNDQTIKELSYFHAKQNTRYRTTVYEPGSVTMVSGNDGNGYGDYSKYEDKDKQVYHTGFGGNWYVNWNSVEYKFVTLNDFQLSEFTGWKYDGGVYSLELYGNDEATTMAREFVVPMLVCDVKYLTFGKLTVQEVGKNLVMRVYLHETESGKTNGKENLLSTAVISKNAKDIDYEVAFELGVNGNEGHTESKTKFDLENENVSYSFGSNYTLTLTRATNVYHGSTTDEYGNSCWKLGTSDNAGEFSFTVSENVTSVIIYVAGYKDNAATVIVNNQEYTINTLSNNGDYTAIVVDTTDNKNVEFECSTSSKRCMIDKIALK